MTSTSRFVLEFALFVLPVLSAFTVAADQVLQIVMAQLLVAAFLHMLSLSLSGRPLISAEHHNSKARRLRVPRKPFITYYRACMLLATCVAILAVDFNIFPRRFAKSETFGTSLVSMHTRAFIPLSYMPTLPCRWTWASAHSYSRRHLYPPRHAQWDTCRGRPGLPSSSLLRGECSKQQKQCRPCYCLVLGGW